MSSLAYVGPTLWLCFGSLFVLTAGLWVSSHGFLLASTFVTLVGAAVGFIRMFGMPAQDAFAGMIVFDSFGLFFSLFAVVATTLGVMVSARSAEIHSDRRPEYYSILLALCTGLIFMGISNHFLMIYLALETVSILSYTLAGFHRERPESVEASMKYVVYGSVASAVMIYGLSLVFGVTGCVTTTALREYMAATPADQVPLTLWVAVLFVFAGIGYKISAAPMHMWTPDVYEGAPTPVSGLLSVAPKAAGFALLTRFFVTAFSQPTMAGGLAVDAAAPEKLGFLVSGAFAWPHFLMISSIFTMFMGNLAALGQISVKRILAYSSIAHAGYVLMGLSTQTGAGIAAMVYYILIYCLMNLGAFWVASKVEDAYGGDELRYFRGLGSRQPFYAAMMAIFLFSLVGIPPFAGFIGKLNLFAAVIAREMYGFALLAAVNSVISLYYYIKIIKAMYLEAPANSAENEQTAVFGSWGAKVGLLALAVPNVILGIYWEPLYRFSQQAVSFFVGGHS